LARWQAWEASDWVVRPWWVEAAFAVLLFLLCIDWDRALSAFMTADTRPTDPTVTNVTLSVVPPLPGRRTIITYQSGQTIVSSEQT
jgi:hypothetical protein